jgi:hypothetical protein
VFSELMHQLGLADSTQLSSVTRGFSDRVRGLQGAATKLLGDLEKDEHFRTAWMMLGEKERHRHLLKGLQDACRQASWCEDTRALCPEIVHSGMLKANGNGFSDLISDYYKGLKDVSKDALYLLLNQWWEKAVDASLPSTEIEQTFALLTIQRNEFIGERATFHKLWTLTILSP